MSSCKACGNEKVMLCPNCADETSAAEIARLRARVEELEGQHKGLVIQNAILRSRPDLPADRIPAANRVAELEADRNRWKAEAMAWRAWHDDTSDRGTGWLMELTTNVDKARAANDAARAKYGKAKR